ncbi:MAG TPA: carboxypeptidase regulatory-like domain-containing protein [Cyclobacteriaceae bacterium]|nr:carboxypeptidase regulatory-like domain-containing protein [Cyclobacteriaceae bacterium]
MKILIALISAMAVFTAAPTGYGQRQGIRGEIFWLGGNQMPGPGKIAAPKLGIQREIFIYKVTTVEKEQQTGPFFTDIKTELVAKASSKDDGTFKVKLPPGEYSVFVKEPEGMFANLIDKTGKINPIVVQAKRFSWLTITVDYQASY